MTDLFTTQITALRARQDELANLITGARILAEKANFNVELYGAELRGIVTAIEALEAVTNGAAPAAPKRQPKGSIEKAILDRLAIDPHTLDGLQVHTLLSRSSLKSALRRMQTMGTVIEIREGVWARPPGEPEYERSHSP